SDLIQQLDPTLMSSLLRLTTDEYDRMVNKGAFDDLDRKVELLRGEVQTMNPAGPVHDDTIEYLTDWSKNNADRNKVRVRVQSGLSLPEFDSRPEPDIAWVKARRYLDRHPGATDVLLLIEVADSSLAIDKTLKAELYAKAGIVEYWVVNTIDQLIHIHRDPDRDGYRTLTTVTPGETASPLAEPEANLNVSDLFGLS
ncbi:MAG: Uma2 family endonuclease, partial [Planctomycetales bacterium]|nr:Uma2 family endonuclease [Planctomycetales bacterium]